MKNVLSFNSLKINNQYVIIDVFRSNKYNSLVLLCNNESFLKEQCNINILSLKVNHDSIELPIYKIDLREEEFIENDNTTDIYYHIPFIVFLPDFPENIHEITVSIENNEYKMGIHPLETNFLEKKCLTTIQANEFMLIESWIEWHKKLGFESFFIYDNNFDSDNYTELLKKYPTELFIYNADFPFFYKEVFRIGQVIQQCHTLWKFSPVFLGLTDLDEYIYPLKGFNLFNPDLAVLSMPNYWFGCNYGVKFSSRNFTNALTKRTKTQSERGQKKCIVQSEKVDLISIHIAMNYKGIYKRATYDEVYLRHYLILSIKKRNCDCSTYCQVVDEPKLEPRKMLSAQDRV